MYVDQQNSLVWVINFLMFSNLLLLGIVLLASIIMYK